MTRLRCVNCRSLIAAYDIDYELTERDCSEALVAAACHAADERCSGSLLVDTNMQGVTIAGVVQ